MARTAVLNATRVIAGRIDEMTYKSLTETAERQNTSKTAVVRNAIVEYLKQGSLIKTANS